MEPSSEASRDISQRGQGKTSERASDVEDNTKNKHRWNGPIFGERCVHELVGSEFDGWNYILLHIYLAWQLWSKNPSIP